MRKQYIYQTIRYLPNIKSDEFINIGVILISNKKIFKLISMDDIENNNCLFFNKRKLTGTLEYLNENILKTPHYFNTFRFSDIKRITSDKEDDEVLEELFEDYVFWKFV